MKISVMAICCFAPMLVSTVAGAEIEAVAVFSRGPSNSVIQVFITNRTSQAFSFHTGSLGGGGSILGPNDKHRSLIIGTAPQVLPEFTFLTDGTTNSWRAVGVGGPTYRSMRPSVFTVAPNSSAKYCEFEVENKLIEGTFVSGRIRSEKPTLRESEPINIPIGKLEFKEEEIPIG